LLGLLIFGQRRGRGNGERKAGDDDDWFLHIELLPQLSILEGSAPAGKWRQGLIEQWEMWRAPSLCFIQPTLTPGGG
jgi:hypothetical protein